MEAVGNTVDQPPAAAPIHESDSESGKENLQKPKTPAWVALLILLVFPPAAWAIMYRDKSHHKWLAFSLILSAAIPLLLYISLMILVLPKLELLFRSMNASYTNTTLYTVIWILVFLSVIEITVGILLYKKCKAPLSTYKKTLYLTILMLTVNFITTAFGMAYIQSSIIFPIYNLTNTIGTVPNPIVETTAQPANKLNNQ